MPSEVKVLDSGEVLRARMLDSQSITNREALKDKIHDIHNYMRNNGAGYGMNALKVFNVLYGLKKIEEHKLLDKVNLKRPECDFSYLLNLANQNQVEDIPAVIFGQVLPSIFGSDIASFLFYRIPQNIKGDVFVHLIKEIDKITHIEKTCNVLLSGKIYEYFIGRDQNAISELGAYFTDRHIVDYIFKKLHELDLLAHNNGEIPTMIDMFGGSGGFTTGYINFMNEQYPGEVDWKTQIKKVFHFDMNEDVIKSAALEFFCLTGVIPDMNKLKYKNSFADEFIKENSNKSETYELVITNPPYGGDTIKKSDAQIKREKIKEFIKTQMKNVKDKEKIKKLEEQLKEIEGQEKVEKKETEKKKVCLASCSKRINKFAKKYELKGNDKESCSLMLMMDLLKEDGVCVGVLKEGVFFNRIYKDLRKCLIENFNVLEVISVPQDQFENTSTKTSIIIFTNSEEKTTEIKFKELVVERYEEDAFEEIDDKVYLTENKGDIKDVYDQMVSTASKDELLENTICSLNGKDYKKKELKPGKGYELVKIGNICKCLPTTKHYTNIGGKNGKYRFYNSSQEQTLFVDFCEVNEQSIILGQGGSFSIHFDKKFTPSKHVCVIQSINNDIIQLQYIYYIIPILQTLFVSNGSVMSWLNKNNIKEFDIPIPKSKEKIKEWVDKISKPYEYKMAKEAELRELEKQVQDKIQEIVENEECEEVELGYISDINMGATPSTKNSKNWENGKHKWVSIADMNNTVIYDTKKKLTDTGIKNMKLIPKNSILMSFKLTIGKVSLAGCDLYCNEAIVYINSKVKNIPQMFLLYLLKVCDIQKYARGTIGIGNLNKEILTNLKLKIPKNQKLINKLDKLFAKIEVLHEEIKQSDTLYKRYIEELGNEAILSENNTSQSNAKTTIVSKEEDTQSNDEEETKEIKVKTKSKSKKKVIEA